MDRASWITAQSFLSNSSSSQNSAHSSYRITSAGFGFLLATPHAQLWLLLLKYLDVSKERSLDLVEVLAFLLLLSTLELGVEYSATNLTHDQLIMLKDMSDYGLVYIRGVGHYLCQRAEPFIDKQPGIWVKYLFPSDEVIYNTGQFTS